MSEIVNPLETVTDIETIDNSNEQEVIQDDISNDVIPPIDSKPKQKIKTFTTIPTNPDETPEVWDIPIDEVDGFLKNPNTPKNIEEVQTFNVNGELYDIPNSKAYDFLKKNKNAVAVNYDFGKKPQAPQQPFPTFQDNKQTVVPEQPQTEIKEPRKRTKSEIKNSFNLPEDGSLFAKPDSIYENINTTFQTPDGRTVNLWDDKFGVSITTPDGITRPFNINTDMQSVPADQKGNLMRFIGIQQNVIKQNNERAKVYYQKLANEGNMTDDEKMQYAKIFGTQYLNNIQGDAYNNLQQSYSDLEKSLPYYIDKGLDTSWDEQKQRQFIQQIQEQDAQRGRTVYANPFDVKTTYETSRGRIKNNVEQLRDVQNKMGDKAKAYEEEIKQTQIRLRELNNMKGDYGADQEMAILSDKLQKTQSYLESMRQSYHSIDKSIEKIEYHINKPTKEGSDAVWYELKNIDWTNMLTLGYSRPISELPTLQIAKKKASGVPLTDDEEFALNLYQLNEMVKTSIPSTSSGNIVYALFETIPYMAGLALTGGTGTALKIGTETLLKNMLPKFAVSNVINRAIGTTVMATFQGALLGSTVESAINATIANPETNLWYNFLKEVPQSAMTAFVEIKSIDLLKSIAKIPTSDLGKMFAQSTRKTTGGKIDDVFSTLFKGSDDVKVLHKFLEEFGEEKIEEFNNIVIFDEGSWGNFVSLKSNLETFSVVALMQGGGKIFKKGIQGADVLDSRKEYLKSMSQLPEQFKVNLITALNQPTPQQQQEAFSKIPLEQVTNIEDRRKIVDFLNAKASYDFTKGALMGKQQLDVAEGTVQQAMEYAQGIENADGNIVLITDKETGKKYISKAFNPETGMHIAIPYDGSEIVALSETTVDIAETIPTIEFAQGIVQNKLEELKLAQQQQEAVQDMEDVQMASDVMQQQGGSYDVGDQVTINGKQATITGSNDGRGNFMVTIETPDGIGESVIANQSMFDSEVNEQPLSETEITAENQTTDNQEVSQEVAPSGDNANVQADIEAKKADIERRRQEENEKRAEYGLEELKPTYRGTTLSEWENIQDGKIISSDNMQDTTWVSDKKEYSDEFVKNREDGVLIEFKPEAIDKSVHESGQVNDTTGVRLGKGLTINDIQRVTDSKGRVLYDAELQALESTQPTDVSTQPQSINTEATDASTQPTPEIPRLKDGSPDFDNMQPEMLGVELEKQFGNDRAKSILRNQIKNQREALKRLDKKKAKTINEEAKNDIEKNKVKDNIKRLETSLMGITESNVPMMQKREQPKQKVVSNDIQQISEVYQSSPKVYGRSKQMTLPNGEKVKGRFVLIEAGSAVPSHDPFTFEKTKGFPTTETGTTVNDRDYEKDEKAQGEVILQSQKLDDRAYSNPVMITSDGIVVSGNQRTMTRIRAAQQGTDTDYTTPLREDIDMYGISQEQFDNLNNPQLVFELDETPDYTTDTFAKFNTEDKKSQSTTESAVKVSKTIKPDTISKIGDILDKHETLGDFYSDNQAIAEALTILQTDGVIRGNDVARLVKSDGVGLSDSGKEFFETLLIGSVLNESAIRQIDVEGMRNVKQKIAKAIVPIVNNAKLKEYNLVAEISEAVNIVERARKNKLSVSNYISNGNIFDKNEYSDAGVFFAVLLDNSKESQFRNAIINYNTNAILAESGQMDIFSGEVTTKEQIVETLIQNADAETKQILQKAWDAVKQNRNANAFFATGTTPTGSTDVTDVAETPTSTEATSEVKESISHTPETPTETKQRQKEVVADALGIGSQRIAEVETMLNELSDKTKKQAKTTVVRSNADAIVQMKKDKVDTALIEAFQDVVANGHKPEAIMTSHGLYIVSSNIKNAQRAVEVWMHEQAGHYGIRLIMPDATQRKAFFTDIYNSVGEANIRKELEEGYDKVTDKAKLGEEYFGRVCEKVARQTSLNELEQGVWENFLNKLREFISNLLPSAKLSQGQIESIAKASIQNIIEVRQKTDIQARQKMADIEVKADNTNTNPTEAQKKAGNYEKGKVSIQGLQITIENPKGSVRSGTDKEGNEWFVELNNHYGYFNRTNGKDGDQIDVFIGDNPTSKKVFVVDQVDTETREFDESKVMLGFDTIEDAELNYLLNYEAGWQGLGKITEVDMDTFKTWLNDGKRQLKPFGEYKEIGSETVKTEKIEDYGEKIEGARKDQLKKYMNKINLNGTTLSSIFPKPDISKLLESGLSIKEASAVKVAYEFASSEKKRKSMFGGKEKQISNIKFYASYAKTVLSENLNINFNNEGWVFTDYGKSQIELRTKAYEEVVKELGVEFLNLDLTKVKIFEITPTTNRYRTTEIDDKYKYEVQYYVNVPKKYETLPEAITEFVNQVKANTTTDTVEYKRKLNIYQSRENRLFFIAYNQKGKGLIKLKEDIKTSKEAFEAIKNQEELAELHLMLDRILAERKSETKSTKPRLKYTNETARERVGKDWRNGKNVNSKELAETFGFRAIEFGNWVNNGERQVFVNNTYDSLMDLAQLLNVTPKSISLAGNLGITFGSRGTSQASAHFEPDRKIINLTKTKGLGSLAHEWWHAMDNYFTDFKYTVSGMKSASALDFKEDVRPEVREAFNSLYNILDRSDMKTRSMKLDNTRTTKYFSLSHEISARAFENYVLQRLNESGQINDFIVNYVSNDDWNGDVNHYPYPSVDETSKINDAFKGVFDVIEVKEVDGKDILFSIAKKETPLERKQKQFEIINNTNPMLNSYQVGIRSVNDIKTFDEAIQVTLNEGYTLDDLTYPDMSEEMINEALRTGKITVYSSKQIKNGNFVTPSFIQAQEYAGGRGNKVYSKKVNINDVAWINLDEGQYANINESTDILFSIAPESIEDKLSRLTPLQRKQAEQSISGINKQIDENQTAINNLQKEIDKKRKSIDSRISQARQTSMFDELTKDDYITTIADVFAPDLSQQRRAEVLKPMQKQLQALQTQYNDLVKQRRDKVNQAITQAKAQLEMDFDAMFSISPTKEYKPIPKQYYDKLLTRLNKAFPNVSISTDTAEMERVLNEVEGVRKLTTPTGELYGMTHMGKIYLDGNKMNANAPIHEYGHIWADIAQKQYPEVYNHGLELIKGTEYETAVRESGSYKGLSDEQIWNEALITAIGDRGERIVDKAIRNKFVSWLKDLFNNIRMRLGINRVADLSKFDLSKMDLSEFVKRVNLDLLGGVPISYMSSSDIAKRDADKLIIGIKGATRLDEINEATIRVDNLKVAEEMEKADKTPTEIRLATGWERGADNKWRYEVEDMETTKKFNNLDVQNKAIKLSEAINNTDLFNAYPELKDVKVKVTASKEYSGGWDKENNIINLSTYIEAKDDYNEKAIDEAFKSVLIHEIQHAIQSIEGFARGGNIQTVVNDVELAKDIIQVESVIKKAIELKNNGGWLYESSSLVDIIKADKSIPDNIAEWAVNVVNGGEAEIKAFMNETPFNKYQRLAGEVEARNAQARMNFTPEQRILQTLASTEDISRADQIIIHDTVSDTPMFSIAPKDLEADTKMVTRTKDIVRDVMQDRLLSVKMLQDYVVSKGGTLTNATDTKAAVERYSSKVNGRFRIFEMQVLRPLTKFIANIEKTYNLDSYTTRDYLLAKASLARHNAGTSALSEDVNDTWNIEAVKKIITDYEIKVDASDIAELWDKTNTVNDFSMKALKDAGILTKEQYDTIKAKWDYYVPLRGWDLPDEVNKQIELYTEMDKQGIARSGDTTYSEALKKAKGRKSKAYDPISTMSNIAYSSLITAEKNIAEQSMLNFIRQNKDFIEDVAFVKRTWIVTSEDGKKEKEVIERPDQSLFDAGRVKNKRNKDTREFSKYVTPQSQQAKQIEVYENGIKYVIEFKQSGVAEAIRGTNMFKMPKVFDVTLGKATRFLSKNLTGLNPDFIPVNFIRDFGYAMLTNYVNANSKISNMDIINEMRQASKAIKAFSWSDNFDETNPLHKDFMNFINNGGATGYVNMQKLEKVKKQIDRDLKVLAGSENKFEKSTRYVKAPFAQATRAIGFLGDMSELTMRYSVYRAGIKAGLSVNESVDMAKNITVNFNRKGRISGVLGGLYAFYNASIQGGNNFVTLAYQNKGRMAKVALSFMAMGALWNVAMTMLMGGNPDDDESYYNVNEFSRYNNLIIPTGVKNYIKIPLPYVFRSFFAMGQIGVEMMTGQKSFTQGILGSMDAMLDGLSPVNLDLMALEGDYAGSTFIRTLLPTTIQPMWDLRFNRNFFGQTITRETFDKSTPKSQLGKANVSPVVRTMAETFNAWSGGDKFKSGVVDINPSAIEYLFESYTGGRGRFYLNLVKIGQHGFKMAYYGADDSMVLETKNIPIGNRFIGENRGKNWGAELKEMQSAIREDNDLMRKYYKNMDESKDFKQKYEAIVEKYDNDIVWTRGTSRNRPTPNLQAVKILDDHNKQSKLIYEDINSAESQVEKNRLYKVVSEMSKETVKKLRVYKIK